MRMMTTKQALYNVAFFGLLGAWPRVMAYDFWNCPGDPVCFSGGSGCLNSTSKILLTNSLCPTNESGACLKRLMIDGKCWVRPSDTTIYPEPDEVKVYELTRPTNVNITGGFFMNTTRSITFSGGDISTISLLDLPAGLQNLAVSANQLEFADFNLPDSLQRLALSRNKLEAVSFKLPPSLRSLFLGSNRIKALDFNLPDSLQTLDVGFNMIEAITKPLPENLRSLNLDGNKISSITVPLPPRLYELRLTSSELKTLPFKVLPSTLERLFLTHNQLQVFDLALPSSSKLRTLVLDQNELDSFDLIVPPSLTELDLSQNKFKTIPVTLGWSQVEDLKMGHNQLQKADVLLPPRLKILDLSYNQIPSIEIPLPGSLRAITIVHNSMQLDIKVPLPANLSELTLDHTELHAFDHKLPNKLSWLSLRNCSLVEFSSELPESLRKLDLGDNPQLQCLSVSSLPALLTLVHSGSGLPCTPGVSDCPPSKWRCPQLMPPRVPTSSVTGAPPTQSSSNDAV